MQATNNRWEIWSRANERIGTEDDLFRAMYWRYNVQSDAELFRVLAARIPKGTLIDQLHARHIRSISMIEREDRPRVAPDWADVDWLGLLQPVAEPMPGFDVYIVNGRPIDDMVITAGHEIMGHPYFYETRSEKSWPTRIANAQTKPSLPREERICDSLGIRWPITLGADRGSLEDILRTMSELPPFRRTWWISP